MRVGGQPLVAEGRVVQPVLVGVLGDGDDPDTSPPEHGLEGDGVLPLHSQAGALPDQSLLEGGVGAAGLIQHPAELGPVGDAAALGLVHVLAGHDGSPAVKGPLPRL